MDNLDIYLASKSKSRHEILARTGYKFICKPANIDESPYNNESPSNLATRLAKNKALRVYNLISRPNIAVIGSDQICYFYDKKYKQQHKLGKPANFIAAQATLSMLRHQKLYALTAVHMITCNKNKQKIESQHLDLTVVQLNNYSNKQLNNYLTKHQPFDATAGIKIEHDDGTIVKSVISVDPAALMGLPILAIKRMLHHLHTNRNTATE